MKQYLRSFLYLVLASATIVLALTCGTTWAQTTDNFISITEPQQGLAVPSLTFTLPPGIALPIRAPTGNGVEQLSYNWTVAFTDLVPPQTVKLTESTTDTTPSDFLTLSQITGGLNISFWSDGAAGFNPALPFDTQIVENGDLQVAAQFTITITNTDFCDPDEGDICSFPVQVLVQSDEEPTQPPTTAPEPATLVLLGVGLASVVGVKRRFKK